MMIVATWVQFAIRPYLQFGLDPMRLRSPATRRVVNGLCCATCAAAPFVIWDVNSLWHLGIPHRLGWGLGVGAAAIGIVLSAWLTMVLMVIFGPPLGRWTERWRGDPRAAGASAGWTTAGVIGLTGVTYATVFSCQAIDSSSDVLPVAVPLSVAGFAATWTAIRAPFESAVIGLPDPSRRSLLLPGASLVCALSCIGVLLVAALPILAQLELRPWVSWTSVAGAAVLGICIPPRPRRRALRVTAQSLRRLALVLWLVSLVLIGGSLTGPMSSRLDLALELRATSTSYLTRALRSSGQNRVRPAEPPADRSAVCRPGDRPPTLDDIRGRSANVDIIFITVDALRWDHMSLSGYGRKTTPQIDRHASDAVIFEQAYALAGTTRQTFRGLLTGVYASLIHEVRSQNSNWGFGFTDAQVTLAEMLRHAGHETIAYSTQGHLISAEAGALDGFSEIDESARPIQKDLGYSDDYMLGKIIDRLSRPDGGTGRFVWTHLMATHHPYPGGPEPVSYGDKPIDHYDRAIHFVDREIGRVLDLARAPGRADRTWVIVTADHGEGFMEHGHLGHGSEVYQEHIHVPMIIWGPGVEARRLSTPISQIHLGRTILEMAGIAAPPALCGTSLLPALRGEPPPEQAIYVETIPDFGRSDFRAVLIRGPIKTVIRPNSGARQLYDLDADPGEKHNLVDERPELLREELVELRRFHLRHGLEPKAYGL